MVKVIKSDFRTNDHNTKELNWQIVNLTSILVNRNVNKLIDDLTSQINYHQSTSFLDTNELQVTTIDLNNDQNDLIQPMHLKNYLSFADDDLFNENLYFWNSPEQYIGNKLYALDNELQFKLAYSVLRGDVAPNKCKFSMINRDFKLDNLLIYEFICKGNYEQDPDVLMAGIIDNRLEFIGFKWSRYQNKFKCDIPITIRIKLKEHLWFKLDNGFKMTNHTINRLQFALILNSIRLLLIRASYHSDQIEARLYTVTMGITDSESGVLPFQAKITEKCVNCSGNTEGLYCERCKLGYYGNPISEHFCRPCKCPNTPESKIYHADNCLYDVKRNRSICQVS